MYRPTRGVQVIGRLIENQELIPERPRESDPHPLATTQMIADMKQLARKVTACAGQVTRNERIGEMFYRVMVCLDGRPDT